MRYSYTQEVEIGARALVDNHLQIKAYVKRYRERSSQLLAMAARTLENDLRAKHDLLQFARSREELRDTLELLRRVGPDAAPLLPEIITAYYGGHFIDTVA